MQLNAKKIEIIELLMNTDNEKIVMKLWEVVRKSTQADCEPIPGMPHTPEELRAAVQRSEEQYAQGRTVTIEQLQAKHPRA